MFKKSSKIPIFFFYIELGYYAQVQLLLRCIGSDIVARTHLDTRLMLEVLPSTLGVWRASWHLYELGLSYPNLTYLYFFRQFF
jgi:hypothetical protein